MPLNSDGSYTLSEEGTRLPVGKGSERYNPETGKFERVAEGGGPANGGPGSGNDFKAANADEEKAKKSVLAVIAYAKKMGYQIEIPNE